LWSAKHKILICVGIRGPLVVRGADFGNHWVSPFWKVMHLSDGRKKCNYLWNTFVSFCWDAEVIITTKYVQTFQITFVERVLHRFSQRDIWGSLLITFWSIFFETAGPVATIGSSLKPTNHNQGNQVKLVQMVLYLP